MLLEDKFNLELRLRELQEKLPKLVSFSDKLDAEDEMLEIKKLLGMFKQSMQNGGDECINCSG